MSHSRVFMLLVVLLMALTGFVPTAKAQNPTPPDSVFAGLEPITAENADWLIPLMTLGMGRISTMKWSPDGSVIALGTSTGVRVLNAHDLNTPPPLAVHDDSFVYDIAFNADGSLFAAAEMNGMIYVWETATWGLKFILPYQPEIRSYYSTIYLHFDDETTNLVLTAGIDYSATSIQIWDAQTGRHIQTETKYINLYGEVNSIRSLMLYEAGLAGFLSVWDIQTARKIKVLYPPGWVSPVADASVGRTAYSVDGAWLAFGRHDDIPLWIWNTETWQSLYLSNAHSDGTSAIAFNPTASLLASSGGEHTLKLWNPETGELLSSVADMSPAIDLQFSPDGNILAVLGQDRILRLLDVAALLNNNPSERDHIHLPGHNLWLKAAYFDTKSGQLIAYDKKAIYVWTVGEFTSQQIVFAVNDVSFDGIQSLDVSPNGRWIVAISGPWPHNDPEFDTTILVDTDSDMVSTIIHEACNVSHLSYNRSVTISPDNRFVAATCLNTHTVHLWELATGDERVFNWPESVDYVPNVMFMAEDELLTTVNQGERDIWIWYPETGEISPQIGMDTYFMSALGYHRNKLLVYRNH
ncbi:MAG: hypothetical protein JXA10_12260, partial [Anaerolineae bacterium]|nr:hypothetical protein [Anaerolineae bacterium]